MLPHIVYWLGAVADWWTTRRGLKKGMTEVNPVVRSAMDKLGRDWGITFLKMSLWLILYLTGASDLVFYVAGGIQLAAAIWNVTRK